MARGTTGVPAYDLGFEVYYDKDRDGGELINEAIHRLPPQGHHAVTRACRRIGLRQVPSWVFALLGISTLRCRQYRNVPLFQE